MPFIANTDKERAEMLAKIGCANIEEMWDKTRAPKPTSDFAMLPDGKSEFEVSKIISDLADKNAKNLVCFLGMGYYDHFIPATVSEVTSRTEFYTAYTPYQPEASQGTLQAIFEYQSMMCRLTGTEASNASLYDGGTAVFEAMAMAMRISRKSHIVISGAVSPIFRKMVDCYSANLDCQITCVDPDGVGSNPKAILAAMTEQTACVIVQYPNVFGTIEAWGDFVAEVKARKAISVCACYPTALSVLKTPGEMGFDIVVGEGQCLGIPLSFGGPYLGFMCTSMKHMRKMPGRIVGRGEDSQGKTAYVLTMQAREQHIRREGAMSNICSNESLCALAATVYMTSIGDEGLKDVAKLSMSKARYAQKKLCAIPGVKAVGDVPFFNEFVVELPCDAANAVGLMVEKGFAAGFPLSRYYPNRPNELLVTVTEKRTKEEINAFCNALEAVVCN